MHVEPRDGLWVDKSYRSRVPRQSILVLVDDGKLPVASYQ
jgi:hypothetical protein